MSYKTLHWQVGVKVWNHLNHLFFFRHHAGSAKKMPWPAMEHLVIFKKNRFPNKRTSSSSSESSSKALELASRSWLEQQRGEAILGVWYILQTGEAPDQQLPKHI